MLQLNYRFALWLQFFTCCVCNCIIAQTFKANNIVKVKLVVLFVGFKKKIIIVIGPVFFKFILRAANQGLQLLLYPFLIFFKFLFLMFFDCQRNYKFPDLVI